MSKSRESDPMRLTMGDIDCLLDAARLIEEAIRDAYINPNLAARDLQHAEDILRNVVRGQFWRTR